MKVTTTLRIETDSRAKVNALLRFLKEMGISVTEQDAELETRQVSMVSEPSLAEAWLSAEDDRWDELYAEDK